MIRSLFIRKSAHSQFEEGGEEHHLKRHLGPLQLVAIGIGAIIGAGIFVITGQAAALYSGPGIVISFLIAAVVCLFAGLCYAELASMIPISGGSYSYAYVAMGEFPAWIVGWAVTAQYLVSASTVAAGWSGYLIGFLQDFGIVFSKTLTEAPIAHNAASGWAYSGAILNVPAMLVVALVGISIAIGIRAAAYFNNIMVVIKLSTIVLFVAMGIFHIQSANWSPFIPENTGVFGAFGWSGILRASGLVFFAYLGFDTVATLAQDAKNPQKSLPIGILGSLGICTIAYVVVSLVLTGVVSYRMLNVPDPMAVALDAMGQTFGWLKTAVKLAIIAGLSSVILIQLLGQTRIFYAISKDGLLPRRFSKISPKTRTPLFTSILTTAIVMVLAGLFPIAILGELASMTTLFLFIIVCGGVLILRYQNPEYPRGFRVPFVPLIPALGIIASAMQMGFMPTLTWIQLTIWIGVGLFLYFCYGFRHSKLRASRR
jgi:APA family basic amino acid/polyamine antiporter